MRQSRTLRGIMVHCFLPPYLTSYVRSIFSFDADAHRVRRVEAHLSKFITFIKMPSLRLRGLYF